MARAPGLSGKGGAPEKSSGATTVSRLATMASHTVAARPLPTPVAARARRGVRGGPPVVGAEHLERDGGVDLAGQPGGAEGGAGGAVGGGGTGGRARARPGPPSPAPSTSASATAARRAAAAARRFTGRTVPICRSHPGSGHDARTDDTGGPASPAPHRRPRRCPGTNRRVGVPTRGHPGVPHLRLRVSAGLGPDFPHTVTGLDCASTRPRRPEACQAPGPFRSGAAGAGGRAPPAAHRRWRSAPGSTGRCPTGSWGRR